MCGKNCNTLLENSGAGDRNSVIMVEINIGSFNRLSKSANSPYSFSVFNDVGSFSS